MPSCHDMKVGEIYICEECGLELKVVKECTDTHDDCGCGDEGHCDFSCCGGPLTKKS
jgi:hypothetical protein